jgi:hypothetical protein
MASSKQVWHVHLLNLQATNYKTIYKLKLVVDTRDLPVNTLLNMFECVRVCIYIYFKKMYASTYMNQQHLKSSQLKSKDPKPTEIAKLQGGPGRFPHQLRFGPRDSTGRWCGGQFFHGNSAQGWGLVGKRGKFKGVAIQINTDPASYGILGVYVSWGDGCLFFPPSSSSSTFEDQKNDKCKMGI